MYVCINSSMLLCCAVLCLRSNQCRSKVQNISIKQTTFIDLLDTFNCSGTTILNNLIKSEWLKSVTGTFVKLTLKFNPVET